MFYELLDNDDLLDEPVGGIKRPIYAAESNLDDVEYKDVKKGYFSHLIADGKKLDSLPELKFYYSSKVSSLKTEYLINHEQWPIVHEKVMKEFKSLKLSHIQYIPITLIDIDTNQECHEYYAMNILDCIEAIDLEKSEYDYDEEFNVYWFMPRSIYLNRSACSGHNIFRATKHSASLYVSEKVKSIIENHNWIGFAFRKEKLSVN